MRHGQKYEFVKADFIRSMSTCHGTLPYRTLCGKLAATRKLVRRGYAVHTRMSHATHMFTSEGTYI